MVGRDPVTLTAFLVVLVVFVAGPLTGIDVTSAGQPTVGDGDMTVDTVSVDGSALATSPGRFGADVTYLRIPTATVAVESVTGRPRVVYHVSVPGLDVDRVATRVVTTPGTYRLTPDDYALEPGTTAGTYEAALAVRVQSFGASRTVSHTTVTVEVAP